MLAAGCGSRRAAVTASAPSPYERKPIAEVTEEQLKEDSQLIDALTLQETGRLDEALGAYARLTAERPGCAAAWYGQGQLLMQRGWTDSALRCTERAVALQGDNVWYLLALAQCHRRSGDTRGLTSDWERIVKLQPSVTEHYYELSNAYLAADNLEGAVEALDRLERRVGVTEPVSLQKQQAPAWESGINTPARLGLQSA